MKRSLRRGCNDRRAGVIVGEVRPSMKRSLRRGCNVVLTVVMGMLLSALNEAQPPERLQRPRRRVHGPDLRPSMKRSLRRGCNAILRQTSAAALAPQ